MTWYSARQLSSLCYNKNILATKKLNNCCFGDPQPLLLHLQ